MLGEKLRDLREEKGMLQREVAASLSIDTAYVSKMEKNEKPVSKTHLKQLAIIFGVNEKSLMPLWLAEKIKRSIKDEGYSKQALELVLNEINYGQD
ncbi:helix-turn-helix transcriptional regulator [Algoriphagus halophytocola]|uniref:helix-turn-helix domain-containing protein n=1 Tax=Algoriphagus halophytocola TaxID=2991499 RepID=UPI0022DCFAC5|nr:helix-turn-helix transcriptional regulator [Algoriphagus sp. TR-M9]WBL42310.1 helix-turn-helix transcriptional regulator [Algoriphagus sp. TR-M9]